MRRARQGAAGFSLRDPSSPDALRSYRLLRRAAATASASSGSPAVTSARQTGQGSPRRGESTTRSAGVAPDDRPLSTLSSVAPAGASRCAAHGPTAGAVGYCSIAPSGAIGQGGPGRFNLADPNSGHTSRFDRQGVPWVPQTRRLELGLEPRRADSCPPRSKEHGPPGRPAWNWRGRSVGQVAQYDRHGLSGPEGDDMFRAAAAHFRPLLRVTRALLGPALLGPALLVPALLVPH